MGIRTVISDLPKELIQRIGNCLDTDIDILRFRAVCRSWRNSLINPLFLPFKIPFPLNADRNLCIDNCTAFYLIESTVYLLKPLDGANNIAPSSYRGWLLKLTKTVDGKLRVFNPLIRRRIFKALPADNMPKVLNLQDFRVSQVCKSYHLQFVAPLRQNCLFRDEDVGSVKKVLLSTNNFSLMAIHHSMHMGCNQLYSYKFGDVKWTKLKDAGFNIVDIIVYKENFLAVDRYGKIIKFDPSFNETIVSSILPDGDCTGRRKRLVESCEQLFLVDIGLDIDNTSLKFNLYRLDEEQHQWITVHTLGDRIFFAGDDCCFSVSSKDFGEGCKGNCIYFANIWILWDNLQGEYCDYDSDDDDVRELDRRYYSKGLIDCSNTGVYTIEEDGKLGSSLSFVKYADIVWPPPSWLDS